MCVSADKSKTTKQRSSLTITTRNERNDDMQIKNALKRLSTELDNPGSEMHEAWEIIANLPDYLSKIPLTEKQRLELEKLVKEYCAIEARIKTSPGSSRISLVGILNWLDVRCGEYCDNNRQRDGRVRFIDEERRKFRDRGGWSRWGVG